MPQNFARFAALSGFVFGLVTILLTSLVSNPARATQACRGYTRQSPLLFRDWYHGGAKRLVDTPVPGDVKAALERLSRRAKNFGRAGSETDDQEIPATKVGTLGASQDKNVRSYLDTNPVLMLPFPSVDLYLTEWLRISRSPSGAVLPTRGQQVSYRTASERIIAAAYLKFDMRTGSLVMEHPDNHAAGIIFQDVKSRIRALSINPSRFSFATAVQGWFNAMPYFTEDNLDGTDIESFKSVYRAIFAEDLNIRPGFPRWAMGRSASEVESVLGLGGR